MPTFLGWWWVRLVIGLVGFGLAATAAVGVAFLAEPDVMGGDASRDNPAPVSLALATAALAVLAYCAHLRWIERKAPFRSGNDFSLSKGPAGNAAAEFAIGCMIALGLMALIALVLCVAGAYEITAINPVSFIVPALMTGIMAGFFEEILLRGLLFRLPEEWMGSGLALIFSSLLFGFLHGANPNATLFSSVAIALEAGVLLGLAYMFTRRLWMVIGIHLAWNTTIAGLFGFPVSGYALPSILEARVEGPDWLTGGAFGPEASVTAIAVCGLAIGLFAWGVWKRGEWRRASWGRKPLPSR